MKFVCILMLFSFYSCKNLKVAGLYGDCIDGFLSCNQLLINEDSTFTYYEYWDVGGTHNKVDGFWKRLGDTLFLTSYNQNEPCKLSFTYSTPYLKSKVGITIKDSSGEPASKTIFKAYSNGKERIQFSDATGFCQFENLEYIDSMRVSSLGFPFCDSLFVFDTRMSVDYHFQLDFNHENISMKNEPWLLKGKKVYFYQDSTGKFDTAIFKKKTTLNKKVF